MLKTKISVPSGIFIEVIYGKQATSDLNYCCAENRRMRVGRAERLHKKLAIEACLHKERKGVSAGRCGVRVPTTEQYRAVKCKDLEFFFFFF